MKKILPLLLIPLVIVGAVVAYQLWKDSNTTSNDFVESGKKYFAQKKYAEAAIEFSNAVQKDDRNRDARFYLARTYYVQGNFQEAIKHLKALLDMDPSNVEANLELGNLFLAAGASDSNFYKLAVASAQKLLAQDPNNVRALLLEANAKVGLQDYSSSIESYEKALSLDPQNISAFLSLGTS